MVLAIDPGNVESAYCIIDKETYRPIKFGKVQNDELLDYIDDFTEYHEFAIEMVASYGMAVGREVFETCVWIGRFIQKYDDAWYDAKINYIYRKDVKMNLCYTMKAKDSNIRQALIDRFGVVGTKNNQGWFYGFKADVWSAYAVGVTYLDKKKMDQKNIT